MYPRFYLLRLLSAATLLLTGTAMGILSTPTVAHAQLLAHYELNGSTVDSSGNGQNATNFGATTTTDRFGNVSGALFFDGSSNYIQTPLDSNFLPLSFSVWFRADDVTGERSIIDSDTAFAFGHSLILGYGNGDGNLDVQFHEGSYDSGAAGVIAPGVWNHAVVNYGTTIELYLNGTLILNQPYTPGTLDGSNFRIGRHNAGDPQFFRGAIDDVRFFGNTLNQNQVTELFNTSAAAPEPGTLALLAFGTTVGSIAARRRKHSRKV